MFKSTFALLLLAGVGLAACSTSGTSILVGEGGAQPPTDPDAIARLIEPSQRKHTIIALVEGVAATDGYFTKARTETAAIAAMSEEAARIGANAIVLTGKGTKRYGQVTFGNTVGSSYGQRTSAGFNASAYATTVTSSMGWERITFSSIDIRYTDEPKGAASHSTKGRLPSADGVMACDRMMAFV